MADDGVALLDGIIDRYFRRRPVNATFTGMHEVDHLLPDWSASGVAQLRDDMRADRARIAQQGARGLDDAIARRDWTGIDLALADSFLEIQIAELEDRHFQRGNPSLIIGEAVFAIIDRKSVV